MRSTKGVSRLVTFGNTPAKVDDELIEFLRGHEESVQAQPDRLFKTGERVRMVIPPQVNRSQR